MRTSKATKKGKEGVLEVMRNQVVMNRGSLAEWNPSSLVWYWMSVCNKSQYAVS